MKKFFLVLITALAFVAFVNTFVACGDDDSESSSDTDTDTDSDTDSDVPATISGAMQKGPLLQGSSLTVSMMDSAGIPTGATYPTTTEDDLGSFSVVAATSGPCELIGEGYYYNEITDNLSGAPITLRALYEIAGSDPQKAYLNVFTHMSSGMALDLFRNGSEEADGGVAAYTVEDAVALAEDTLFGELGIQHPLGGGLVGHGTGMDLTNADSPDNQYLMAVSCIIGQAAELRAASPDEVDARLQELLNDIRSQIQTSHVISPAYKQYLRDGEAALDPITDCVDNLANYLYSKTGEEPVLPDPNQSADMDGDGHVNANDDDIDGDGVPNDDNGDDVTNTADCTAPTAPCEDEAPYDPTVGNGMYIDATNVRGWQLNASDTAYTWSDAVAYCNDLSFGGNTDWRMPTLAELETLVFGCDDSSCVEGLGPADGCYWMLPLQGECFAYWATDACETSNQRSLQFNIAYDACLIPTDPYYVRCVRTL